MLAVDAVERATCGHPGAPMGMADIAEVLWREHLRHDPAQPQWWDRDRFVLSNGHGSMLLYACLHLSGYDLDIEAIKNFRQLHSPTAGHPEVGECVGVETTTGPLGQGLANAVGMAMAEARLAAEFNREGHNVVDHRTWVFAGDGCLMEGISHEAASLAGTLGLGKLICVYDDNGISIDGEIADWFTEDVPARFEAYGWRVIRNVDGHDAQEIADALSTAQKSDGRPTLVCCRTVIGFGSPAKQGTAGAHGAALGGDEVAATRKSLNWGYAPFEIPASIYEEWDCKPRGQALSGDWAQRWQAYEAAHPELARELSRRMSGELPVGWDDDLDAFIDAQIAQPESIATRVSSQRCLDQIGPAVPELFGGSADLTGSNGTLWKGAGDRYMSWGVREFGMTAMTNGMILHGGFRPYSGTFLVFMEYARNAVRLAALMGVPNVFVYTHDSVAVGEDGPTHQPIEQLTNLRTTPGLNTWRPCDTVETAVAWRSALTASGPSSLVLTRQKTQPMPHDGRTVAGAARGGYVLVAEQGDLDAILIATGSEVGLAVEAAKQLTAQGRGIRVVSMPCAEVFAAQDADYREAVLPSAARARVAVEAAHPDYWHRFVGLDGGVVGIGRFGLSAPAGQVLEACGMTVERVVATVEEVLG